MDSSPWSMAPLYVLCTFTLAWMVPGCAVPSSFPCTSSDQCAPGVCGPAGYCAFEDDACPGSGFAYGEHAPAGISGECVDEGETASTTEFGDSTDGDGDGDATSGDGDGDGDTTVGDGDGDGTAGDGDGEATGGDGDGDGTAGDGDGDACVRRHLTYTFADDSWEVVPLDEVWTSANAPGCDVEPLAATYLEVWDQLLVWGDDGRFYRQINGSWAPPEPIADRWGPLAGVDLDSVTYTPPINQSQTADLIFVARPTAYIYQVYEDGSTVYDQSVLLTDVPPPGPPQNSAHRLWSLVLANPALYGNPAWWTSWQGFDDGRVYRADANLDWQSWDEFSSPLFDGAPVGLEPAALEAAWGDYGAQRAYFVGL